MFEIAYNGFCIDVTIDIHNFVLLIVPSKINLTTLTLAQVENYVMP